MKKAPNDDGGKDTDIATEGKERSEKRKAKGRKGKGRKHRGRG